MFPVPIIEKILAGVVELWGSLNANGHLTKFYIIIYVIRYLILTNYLTEIIGFFINNLQLVYQSITVYHRDIAVLISFYHRS